MKIKLQVIILSFFLFISFFNLTFNNETQALKYSNNTILSDVDASFIGEGGGNYSGGSVAINGDVNGDGYDDILIGAPGNNDNGESAGKIYLILGKATPWTMDMNLSNADASFVGGEFPYQSAGGFLGFAGDVNGDGYDDILIGAAGPYPDINCDYGRLYLFFGGTLVWNKNTNLSNANASFIVENTGPKSFGAGGDVNGDGFDDILIGVTCKDCGPQTYVIFGKDLGWKMNTSLDNSDASIGAEEREYIGDSVAIVGDVNGDNFDDILIGEPIKYPGTFGPGKAYLIFGKADGWTMNMSLLDADASFVGETDLGMVGRSVAGAGDVNGDGFDDILIGFTSMEAKSYLVLGKSSGWSLDTSLTNADASFFGFGYSSYSSSSYGGSVKGIGDVNGDRFDDFLIGLPFNDVNGPHSGQTYLILGKETGWTKDNNLSHVDGSDASFSGEDAEDFSGASISGAGDLNGDGYDDIIIGAFNNREGGNDINKSHGGAGQSYLIFPDINTRPFPVLSVKAYSDKECNQEISHAFTEDEIYIELDGIDLNSSREDIALVKVTSNSTAIGIRIRLYETGSNTGEYRGSFFIKDRTHKSYRWIYAPPGDTITISWIDNTSINTTIRVNGVTIMPKQDNNIAYEDKTYHEHYWAIGHSTRSWALETNASWLSWNNTTHDMIGIPDNGDVGNYWVHLRTLDDIGNYDDRHFIIQVINRPPKITTEDVNISSQNQEYEVDYNCDDDGQGKISWHLKTNSSFLFIDMTNGSLTGIPKNDDIGAWWVNVSVNDGNDGWDWSNFTLTVVDINDPPEIVTKDNTEAIEDIEYLNHYKAIDIDVNNTIFEWNLETNADWLTLNKTIGVLKGTPDNTDVGVSYVNISVRDPGNAFDYHNYTLKVHNAPPMILTRNVFNATEDQEYLIDYDSDDDEQGGVRWGINTEAKWLSINSSTGVLKGTPRNKDVGLKFVWLWADDGYDKGYSNFYIGVTNTNDPPSILSDPPLEAIVDTEYQYQVDFIDIDPEEHGRLLLLKGPDGMRISNGNIISWSPQKGQEGLHEVLIEAIDASNATDNQTYEILVHPHLNVTIVKPIEGQNVSGRLSVQGTVIGPDDVKVEINLDNSSWIEVKGNESWTSIIRTKKLENGNHTITVRATWGDYKSEETAVTFVVDNPEEIKEEDNGWIMWIIILLLFIMALALLAKGMRKDKGI